MQKVEPAPESCCAENIDFSNSPLMSRNNGELTWRLMIPHSSCRFRRILRADSLLVIRLHGTPKFFQLSCQELQLNLLLVGVLILTRRGLSPSSYGWN